ncbi:hypothetical protein AZSI13_13460 [Azospira sp. I13]|nr:hypothetical protein AZSI13_13460 [Azospira sp. I13]
MPMTYHGGQLSITPRSLVVKAADRSRSYGAANPLAGQVVVAGGSLAQGDSLGEAHLSSAAEVTAGAGRQFALTPSSVAFAQGKADNYAITYQDGTLSITKAPLTVTALDGRGWVGSRPWQGGMGVSFAGFLNGDDASDLSGSLSYGGSSQGARKAGSYLLTPGGFASDNYDIAYVDGSLTLRNPPAVATASNTAVPGGGQLHRVTREEDKDSRLPQLPVVPAIPQFAQAPMSFIPYLAVGRDFIALPR